MTSPKSFLSDRVWPIVRVLILQNHSDDGHRGQSCRLVCPCVAGRYPFGAGRRRSPESRHWFQNIKRGWGVVPAIVVTSLLFGGMHLLNGFERVGEPAREPLLTHQRCRHNQIQRVEAIPNLARHQEADDSNGTQAG